MAYTTIDDPTIYFNNVTYTGNGGSQSVTGVGFQPDLVWLKSRSLSQSHFWSDVIRGAGKVLISNNTDAEQNFSANFTAFSSDGYTLANGTNGFNASSETYVSWNWLAGGSASSNSNGDITSSVSANTTAGFSIVSYTGSGVFQNTVGHGLGAIPKMIIVKMRSPDTREWIVYHSSLGNTKKIHLNDNAAAVTQPAWGNTTPTSSVFTISGASQTNWHDTNKASATYIAYCFAEKKGYSKIGSFSGNANANGPFVYTGFRPAWVMIKNSNASEHWRIYDNKRDTFNHMFRVLFPNVSSAESTVDNGSEEIDFLSNGFKIRSSAAQLNGSGNTLIYMSFAESGFVNSNGVPNNAR
jgi:hypothetical protein